MGFGPINPEPETTEPLFHAPWERRALAVSLATGALGHWTTDRSRFTRESLPPAVYYSSSYYEIWIHALINLLNQEGLVSAQEFAEGRAIDPPAPTKRPPLKAEMVASTIAKGSPYLRESSATPRFVVGQPIVTINHHPTGHTRLPRYARGRRGRIESVRGVFVYPTRWRTDPTTHSGVTPSCLTPPSCGVPKQTSDLPSASMRLNPISVPRHECREPRAA